MTYEEAWYGADCPPSPDYSGEPNLRGEGADCPPHCTCSSDSSDCTVCLSFNPESKQAEDQAAQIFTDATNHTCTQCGQDNSEWILGAVCGRCCRKNHRRVAG